MVLDSWRPAGYSTTTSLVGKPSLLLLVKSSFLTFKTLVDIFPPLITIKTISVLRDDKAYSWNVKCV